MITPVSNPINLFHEWLEEAQTQENNDPKEIALATVDPNGQPSVRMVLFKEVREEGFIFCTNLESHKSKDIIGNPKVALCFYWRVLRRQVRVEGIAERISDEEADTHFQNRLRSSQITTIASKQSQPLESYEKLKQHVAELTEKFADQPISRPSFWSGYRIQPTLIEFWQEQPLRLDNRLVYTRVLGNPWKNQYLYP